MVGAKTKACPNATNYEEEDRPEGSEEEEEDEQESWYQCSGGAQSAIRDDEEDFGRTEDYGSGDRVRHSFRREAIPKTSAIFPVIALLRDCVRVWQLRSRALKLNKGRPG